MTYSWWEDLSDDELEYRLINRGWSHDEARVTAQNREQYKRIIDHFLGEHS